MSKVAHPTCLLRDLGAGEAANRGFQKKEYATMINQQTLEGHWNEIKGALKEHWVELTNDDVRRFNGDVDQLVGTIQRRTGETCARQSKDFSKS